MVCAISVLHLDLLRYGAGQRRRSRSKRVVIRLCIEGSYTAVIFGVLCVRILIELSCKGRDAQISRVSAHLLDHMSHMEHQIQSGITSSSMCYTTISPIQ